MNLVKRFLKSEDGPTATEYAVMLALIIVVCITVITSLGNKVVTIPASDTWAKPVMNSRLFIIEFSFPTSF